MKQECKDCNKSLEECTCLEDTIELPNQALKDAAERYEKYSERFDNDESAIGNPETWGKRVLTEEDIFNQRDIDAVTDYIGKETSKQETTLEEAAERLYSDKEYPMYGEIRRDGFINGAKWQQERSYSEEDLECAWSSSEQNMRYSTWYPAYKGITFKQWLEKYEHER